MQAREGSSIAAFRQQHHGYEFASADTTVWSYLPKPLSACRVAVVSLIGVRRRQDPSFSPGGIDRLPLKLHGHGFGKGQDLSFRIIWADTLSRDLVIDNEHLDLRDAKLDLNCLYPIDRIRELQSRYFILALAPRNFSYLGFIPHWLPLEHQVAPELGARLTEDKVDVVLLIPGCTLGHQSAGIMQRHLERAGFCTVSITTAPDVTERLKVPRALAVPYPPSRPFGPPLHPGRQLATLSAALKLVEKMDRPGGVEYLQEQP